MKLIFLSYVTIIQKIKRDDLSLTLGNMPRFIGEEREIAFFIIRAKLKFFEIYICILYSCYSKQYENLRFKNVRFTIEKFTIYDLKMYDLRLLVRNSCIQLKRFRNSMKLLRWRGLAIVPLYRSTDCKSALAAHRLFEVE